MARKRSELPVGPPPVAGWLVIYGEMITIMLCFLVLMFSVSSTDAGQFQEATLALHNAFLQVGISPLPSSFAQGEAEQSREQSREQSTEAILPERDNPQPLSNSVLLEEISEALETLSEEAEQRARQIMTALGAALEARGVYQGVELRPSQRGVIVRFADTVLFDLASATLLPEATEILDALLGAFRALDNILIIEGHTDDRPLAVEGFEDNMDLSTRRALAVWRFYQQRGIDPQRLRVVGYGEYQNIVPNTSEENRLRNRRVDIIILNRQSD